MCKTSFIATITPSAGDIGETMSTLRYAKNAMEALNISQLPRWKQDEIMIEHLRRTNAALIQEAKEETDRHAVRGCSIAGALLVTVCGCMNACDCVWMFDCMWLCAFICVWLCVFICMNACGRVWMYECL